MTTPESQRRLLRQRVVGEEGSIRSNFAVMGVGALALAAVLAYFKNFSFTHTEVTIKAQSVADKISLPASINIVDIEGGSSSQSRVDLSLGPIPAGDIRFNTYENGTTSIELGTLKNPDDSNVTPKQDNTDKYVKLSAVSGSGKNHLLIQVDPLAVSASTKNMVSGPGTTVTTDYALSWFRSLNPPLASQISQGSAAWNDENFRLSCAQEITKRGLVAAGIAKAIATYIQLSEGAITTAIDKVNPNYANNPEAQKQITDIINQLTDPKTIEVQFVSDPNNPQADHQVVSQDQIPYMTMQLPTKEDMAKDVGLKQDHIDKFAFDRQKTCELSPSAQEELQTYSNTWLSAQQQGGN